MQKESIPRTKFISPTQKLGKLAFCNGLSKALLSCCGITDLDEFRTYYQDLVEYTLQHGSLKRESLWTSNLAVGSRQYIEQNQQKFGRQYKIKALPAPSFRVKKYGQIRVNNDSSSRQNDHSQDYVIRDPQTAYDGDYAPENWALRGQNAVL